MSAVIRENQMVWWDFCQWPLPHPDSWGRQWSFCQCNKCTLPLSQKSWFPKVPRTSVQKKNSFLVTFRNGCNLYFCDLWKVVQTRACGTPGWSESERKPCLNFKFSSRLYSTLLQKYPSRYTTHPKGPPPIKKIFTYILRSRRRILRRGNTDILSE